jgi:hypothetical protein
VGFTKYEITEFDMNTCLIGKISDLAEKNVCAGYLSTQNSGLSNNHVGFSQLEQTKDGPESLKLMGFTKNRVSCRKTQTNRNSKQHNTWNSLKNIMNFTTYYNTL